mmetsp:Transcript_13373/g.48686  ORF Transcript_13373/g.48686 Transcript_13373/m.48686 type:complete len:210 (-) Transcript_13373:102-731(-)
MLRLLRRLFRSVARRKRSSFDVFLHELEGIFLTYLLHAKLDQVSVAVKVHKLGRLNLLICQLWWPLHTRVVLPNKIEQRTSVEAVYHHILSPVPRHQVGTALLCFILGLVVHRLAWDPYQPQAPQGIASPVGSPLGSPLCLRLLPVRPLSDLLIVPLCFVPHGSRFAARACAAGSARLSHRHQAVSLCSQRRGEGATIARPAASPDGDR